MRAVLEDAGASLESVVKLNVYLADIATLPEYGRIRAELLPGAAPAGTAVQVGATRDPGDGDRATPSQSSRATGRRGIQPWRRRGRSQVRVNSSSSDRCGVRHADDRVGAAVVDRHPVRAGVDQGGAREDDVRDVADLLVQLLWREEVARSARDDAPRLVEVEQRRAHRVDEAVARREHAVVEDEPALGRLDRGRPGSDLRRLPGERHGRHHVAVPAPVHEVGALRVEDLAERRVAAVARPVEHRVRAADPTGEEDAVPVEREEGIVELVNVSKSVVCAMPIVGPW